ncbi:hypothetical protein C8F01DRAFT_1255201 [Mycena amicta]|nr:hypothetical protein C8F01DRAFT_1255201 [Mycena amicta]
MEAPSASSLRLLLEEIDEETASLRAQLVDLAAKRRDVVEQLRCVTMPVLELPAELTSEIFKHYTQDPVDIGLREVGGPFVLASVCRHWRTIALGFHPLWSRILVTMAEGLASDDPPLTTIRQRLLLCLQRVGHHIDLDIAFVDSDTIQEEIFPLLMPDAQRLSGLNVSLDPNMDCFRGRLPRLRALQIWPPESSSSVQRFVAFEDAPMLRELVLHAVSWTLVSLPWTQLTSLVLYDHREVQEWADVLQQTPNLEKLYIRIDTFADGPLPDDTPEIRLEHLRVLDLEWWEEDSTDDIAVSFMKLLTVPALVDLTSDLCSGAAVVELQTMFDRSLCWATLRSITLRTNGRSAVNVAGVLFRIPFLDKLTVTQIPWDQLVDLLEELVPHWRETNFLKDTEIRELHLEMIAGRIPYHQIARLVESRTQIPDPDSDVVADIGLERLHLSIPSYRPFEGRQDDAQELRLDAIETLQNIAASSDGPKLSITAQENFVVIKSENRFSPPLYTLSD